MDQTFHFQDIVDLKAFPIHRLNDPSAQKLLKTVQNDLSNVGCSVLRGFVRPDALAALETQAANVAPNAYRHVEIVNVYNTDPQAPELTPDHPGRIAMERGNAFVARDQIPDHHIIQQLYCAPEFQAFIAACFGLERAHPMGDPLAGLVVNVIDPGREHPWHFDTNNMTVSLLASAPDTGGIFEYCPGIRSPADEALTSVSEVVTGRTRQPVRTLNLKLGDLQLFNGRHALHRVSEVKGTRPRLSVIFAYCEQPNIVGKPERTRQLFGRALAVHEEVNRSAVRSDTLMD